MLLHMIFLQFRFVRLVNICLLYSQQFITILNVLNISYGLKLLFIYCNFSRSKKTNLVRKRF